MTKCHIWGKESESHPSKQENRNSVFLAIKKSVCACVCVYVDMCVLRGNKGQYFEKPAQHYGIGLVYKNTYKGQNMSKT